MRTEQDETALVLARGVLLTKNEELFKFPVLFIGIKIARAVECLDAQAPTSFGANLFYTPRLFTAFAISCCASNI